MLTRRHGKENSMTHKVNAVGGVCRSFAGGEKWYLKVVHGAFRIFQAVEHLMRRFLEVDPIYPCRH